MTDATEHAVLQLAVLVGSLRAQSFSRKIAKALAARAPDSVRCRFVQIGELPLYNEHLDGGSGSRPPGKSVFKDLPAGVISVSPSKISAFGSNQALRQTFVFLDPAH